MKLELLQKLERAYSIMGWLEKKMASQLAVNTLRPGGMRFVCDVDGRGRNAPVLAEINKIYLRMCGLLQPVSCVEECDRTH